MTDLAQALDDARQVFHDAKDEMLARHRRYLDRPTEKRAVKLENSVTQFREALRVLAAAENSLADAQAKERALHPLLPTFPVTEADVADEAGNPASTIVTEVADGQYEDAPATEKTPVVTLAPVNGEGRFVPIGTVSDGPAKQRNEGLPSAFGGATVGSQPDAEHEQDERDEAEAAQGYVRNEQGAYEYDGPVGEYGDTPSYPFVRVETDNTDLPYLYPHEVWTGDINQEPVSREEYMILLGGPDPRDPEVIAKREYLAPLKRYTRDQLFDRIWQLQNEVDTWKPVLDGGQKDDIADITEHNATATDQLWRGLPVYVSDAVKPGNMYILSDGDRGEGAVTNAATFEVLKAKLEQIHAVISNVGAIDEPESETKLTDEEQAVIDAGKAAQAKVDAADTFWKRLFGDANQTPQPWPYREVFAKAGDVPSAEADHVTGTTDPKSVTLDEERDVQDFGGDRVRMKNHTITSTFTLKDAAPEFFQKIYPNARVVIGSDGKVEITANTMERAAAEKAKDEPRTPEGRLLAETATVIGGDRKDAYGAAEDSFSFIAEFWNTWLTARWREIFDHNMDEDEYTRVNVELTAADVANMLSLMKKGRTAVGGYKHDNYVDEAGYVALAERCQDRGQGL